MSTCISSHGEFGSHELDADYVCTLCGVLDEDALIAELRQARAALDLAVHAERRRIVLEALERFDQQVHWVRTVLFDPEQIRLVDSVTREARKAITLSGCICPLIEITTLGEAGPRYIPGGDHRCGVHGKSKPYVPEGETGQFIERGERG